MTSMTRCDVVDNSVIDDVCDAPDDFDNNVIDDVGDALDDFNDNVIDDLTMYRGAFRRSLSCCHHFEY